MNEALRAIESRLNELTKVYELIKGKDEFRLSIPDYEARIDELETLRDYLNRDSKKYIDRITYR